MTTADRLAHLREFLVKENIDGYYIPAGDEHLNEYPPQAKLRRQWLSGFTGSAGDLLVTKEQAFLFVDSRYYQQADQETDPQFIQVCKLELDGHKEPQEVLADLLDTITPFRLGIDPFVFTLKKVREWQNELSAKGLEIVPIFHNLVDVVRKSLEPLPRSGEQLIFPLPKEITGTEVTEKLSQVRQKMRTTGAEVLPVTKLDQIAWLLNLRGRDIQCNPVFIAYVILTLDRVYLFTDQSRLTNEVRASLPPEVTIADYADYSGKLSDLCQGKKVWVSDREVTYGSYLLIKRATPYLIEKEHPIELLKAKKNSVEIAQMQKANLLASVAKTRTYKWLKEQYQAGKSVSEVDIARQIETFYAQSEGFLELSFPTIAAIGTNGSIVHYGQLDPQKIAQDGDLILLDSGCQFMGGTTDDTRTFVWGEPSPLQKLRYTEILKAHITCAMTQFPKGTNGAQLDGIARANLWAEKLNYGHGTGHGVGAFLNVHEGPNGITRKSQQTLEVGMINSIEPGYYEQNWGGIRLENLYFVREVAEGWLGFQPLTYIPFVKELIDFNRLSSVQLAWLAEYYRAIQDKLKDYLTPDEQTWLAQECSISATM
ncbi:MAG: aminopeptidase P family protein [Pseudanabaenaceae cyanobacterium]